MRKFNVGDKVIVNIDGRYSISNIGSKGIIKKIYPDFLDAQVEFYNLGLFKRSFVIAIEHLDLLESNKNHIAYDAKNFPKETL